MGVSVGLEEMYSVQVKHIERIQNESSFFFWSIQNASSGARPLDSYKWRIFLYKDKLLK